MFVYVGTRTTQERNARGKGINIFHVDPESGKLTLSDVVGDLINPSFLTINTKQDRLYAIHGDLDQVSAFSIDQDTGKLNRLNTACTQGKNPVHLALDHQNQHLIVSNHLTSSLAVLPIKDDGTLGEVKQLVVLEGQPGPHRIEQPFSKPHFNPISHSGKYVVVPDKGLDRVFLYAYQNGVLSPAKSPFVMARESSGPRSAVFHPHKKYLYVLNELDSTVTLYELDEQEGGLIPRQILSSLEDSYTGNSRASHIAIDSQGKYLYASNRGANTIAVYEIHSETGMLKSMQHINTQGNTPRFFTLSPDNRFLYVLNEDSDNIVKMNVSSAGLLSFANEQELCHSPVCMVFAG